MSIVLTNGVCYIATDRKGGIIKTPTIEKAQTFYSVNAAMRKVFKAPGKCKGYYPYDTEDCKSSKRKRRKTYSKEERKIIYDRSEGCCALCGKRLSLENMTLDHIIPLSMNGKDEMENLQASCFTCNQIKNNIMPDDFMEKIMQISTYQINKHLGNGVRWKVIQRLIKGMIMEAE